MKNRRWFFLFFVGLMSKEKSIQVDNKLMV